MDSVIQAIREHAVSFVLGAVATQPKLILHYIVLAVFKVPLLRAYLVGNPVEAKAALAVFVAEVDADIDALGQAHAEASAVPASPKSLP